MYLYPIIVVKSSFCFIFQALSDRLFVADVGRLAEIHAEQSGQPTYSYRFGYKGSFSFSFLMAKNKEDYGKSL